MSRLLLFVYRLPSSPSAPRVALWRALKRLPGTYLRDGVYTVAATRLHLEELRHLAHDVRNEGGTADVFVADGGRRARGPRAT